MSTTMSSLLLPLTLSLLLISGPSPSQAQDESLAGSFLSGKKLLKLLIFNIYKLFILRTFGHHHKYGRCQGLSWCLCPHPGHPNLLRSPGRCALSLAQHEVLY